MLCVEDDLANLRLMEAVLASAGARVLAAARAEAALALASQERPDVVLLDVGLPGVDGLEALAALRRRTETAELPVVLVTGAGREEVATRAAALGAAGVLAKPWRIEELVEAVRAAAAGERSAAAR